MTDHATVAPVTPALKRALGPWDLTAIGVNQVIGAAVFLMPALVAAQVGSWSTVAVLAVGGLSMLIALCFAEASSRVDATGGSYIYTRAAFGRFIGFEVGWMMWFTRVASWAGVAYGLTTYLARYWPVLLDGVGRGIFLTIVFSILTAINIRGIRQSAWVVNTLTVGKLLPLVIFVAGGLAYVEWSRVTPLAPMPMAEMPAALLYLIFAFGGYEVVPVPAGEARKPTRDVPFAMIMTISIVTVLTILVQIVAQGTLADVAASKAPLADAALLFLGGGGALLLTIGAAISTTGNNMGQSLSGSRSLFALAEQGDLPSPLAWVHPSWRTPVVAIVVTSAVALTLALTGSFSTLALASAVSRLLVYAGTAAAVLALRRQGPAPFTIPGGPIVPLAALGICIALVAGATAAQFRIGGAALAIGAVLYLIATRSPARGAREGGTSARP
ncbi:MAG: APC family permease [Acidobacteriota bacterium]|nr:APC family permease [Acidobacteriota bacterium]